MLLPENTYQYSIGINGINLSEHEPFLDSSYLLDGSYNVNIFDSFIKSRGGTEIVFNLHDVPITNIFDFEIKNKTGLLITTADGKIFYNQEVLKSNLAQNQFSDSIRWNDLIIICNQIDIPQIWDSIETTTTDLQNPNPGWINNYYPKQMVVHGKENSERLWVIGAGNSSKLLYYSKTNNGLDEPNFDRDAENESGFIYIETGDDKGLTGIVEFGDRLIAFSNQNAFIILDQNIDNTKWGYTQAQWKGGCASWRLIVRLENDLLCMMKDGTIYSISAVQQYGDYISASITEPSSIDQLFNREFSLENINDFHAVYDPLLRQVKFFGTSSYTNLVNKALVYNVDKTPATGWSLHQNIFSESGYNACSNGLIKNNKIYTGDYHGNIWQLETDKIQDDQNSFEVAFNPPPLSMENSRSLKRFQRGYLEIKTDHIIKFKILFFIDGIFKKSIIIISQSSGGVWDEAIWDQDVYARMTVIRIRYPINLIGRRLTQQFQYSAIIDAAKWDEAIWDQDVYAYFNTGMPFLIGQNLIDFRILGGRI